MRLAKLKLPLVIMLAVAALLAINVAPAMAQPVTSPFTGTVTIDDVAAPDDSEVAVYVGDETEPRKTGTTVDGEYEVMVVGTAEDIGEPVSFEVKEAGTEEWLKATTDPENPTFAGTGVGELQIVDLFAFTGPPSTIAFSPESFSFSATEGGANPADQTLEIWNSGEEGSTLDWEVGKDADWLGLSPTTGSSTGSDDISEVTLSVDITGLVADDYSATISISAEGATNTPQEVPVSLTVSGAPITWQCPIDHQVLVSPYPKNGRPLLGTAADLSGVTTDAEWFQVLWLDESTGVWKWFDSRFTFGNTLLTLEPDDFYLVMVSNACELTIPQ